MINLIEDFDGNVAAEDITKSIEEKLEEGRSVLFLIPGGSSMKVAVRVIENLHRVDTSKLFITLTDERYGRPGHPDENWSQLTNLGMTLGAIDYYRVLRGESPEDTASEFGARLEQLLDEYDYKIGLFGVGVDGHTAGIKPGSVAVESERYAEYFRGDDFERITMTPKAIAKLNEVNIFAQGEEKRDVLWQVANEDVDIKSQPAQALKTAKKLNIYTDLEIDL